VSQSEGYRWGIRGVVDGDTGVRPVDYLKIYHWKQGVRFAIQQYLKLKLYTVDMLIHNFQSDFRYGLISANTFWLGWGVVI